MNLGFDMESYEFEKNSSLECLNIENIREATLGVANYFKKRTKEPRVAIVYDRESNSIEYAKETARVFARRGCAVFMSEKIMSSPFLTYTVRNLHFDLGVSITDSYDTKESGGYKVYGENGGQVTEKMAAGICKEIVAGNGSQEKEAAFEDYKNWGKIHFISNTESETLCDYAY